MARARAGSAGAEASEQREQRDGSRAPASPARAVRDKTYHWRGTAYEPDAPVPDDFPSDEQLAAWQHAPSPFDLDSVFLPPLAPRGLQAPEPFVSAAGEPIAVDPVDETWPARAARENAERAAAEQRGEPVPATTLRTAAAVQELDTGAPVASDHVASPHVATPHITTPAADGGR